MVSLGEQNVLSRFIFSKSSFRSTHNHEHPTAVLCGYSMSNTDYTNSSLRTFTVTFVIDENYSFVLLLDMDAHMQCHTNRSQTSSTEVRRILVHAGVMRNYPLRIPIRIFRLPWYTKHCFSWSNIASSCFCSLSLLSKKKDVLRKGGNSTG